MSDKSTILAVDDTPEALTLLVNLLSPAGYLVLPADSGEIALAAVAASPPDLILLDIHLKGMEGLEVCRRLKADEKTRRIPIILVSAFAEVDVWVRGLRMGAADYISKPFQSEELLARVSAHLSLSQALASSEQKALELRKANEKMQWEVLRRQHAEGELRQGLERAERSRRVMLSVLEDQKQAEDALRRSETRYRLLFESSRDALMTVELPSWHFTSGNPACLELFGVKDMAAFTSLGPWALSPELQPDGRVSSAAAGEMIDIAMARGSHHFEWTHMKISGETFPATVLLTRMESDGKAFLQATVRDITNEKQAQQALRESEERMRQSQKLESIGQLAGGVAHDFNNILGGIMGYADLLKIKLGEASEHTVYARKIADSAEKAAKLTRQLLTFARRGKVDIVPVDAHASIGRVVDILTATIDRRIAITVQLHASPCIVPADAVQLENALLNLGINARDAMPEGGALTFSTSSVTLDGSPLVGETFSPAPGAYIRIEVADTGMGMDEQTRTRAFEPFFTTKPVGKGTGLGLAAVYGLVKQHGGCVTVESSPGCGARFVLYLPYNSRQILAEGPIRDAKVVGGSGLVLIVDDEEALRESAAALVTSFGYSAIAVADGREAVEYFAAHCGRIAVVLMDLDMPRMGGMECLRKLRRIDAGVKVIVVSGGGKSDDAQIAAAQGAVAFLGKPFSAAALSRVLSDASKRVRA